MPESVTPLTARSQTLVSVLLAVMAVMGVSPLIEILARNWPPQFGELAWRYDVLELVLINAPQLLVLLCLIAITGLYSGNRRVVRIASIGFGLLLALQVICALSVALDYFQVRRLIPASRTPGIKALFIKAELFGAIGSVAAAWAAVSGWQASVREGSGHRRKQGEGLVVGQPKPPRPPT